MAVGGQVGQSRIDWWSGSLVPKEPWAWPRGDGTPWVKVDGRSQGYLSTQKSRVSDQKTGEGVGSHPNTSQAPGSGF